MISDTARFLKQNSLNNPDYYDSLVYLDGSRESLRRLYILKNILHMRPLAVTFNHRLHGVREQQTIRKALDVFDIDHIMFTPRKSVIERLLNDGNMNSDWLIKCGSLSFFIGTATKYSIRILIWDPSLLRSMETYASQPLLHMNGPIIEELYKEYDIIAKVTDTFSHYDLLPYMLPEKQSLLGAGLVGVSLDNYTGLDEHEMSLFVQRSFGNHREDFKSDEDSFWIGGPDRESSKVNESRPLTKYEIIARNSSPGEPLFKDTLDYCIRCCMPGTAEGYAFDEMGMCQPCRSSEQKMHINWVERDLQLRGMLDQYCSKDGSYYDCIVPISGGKDSTYQLYVITNAYQMKPLAVTFSHTWFSEAGRYNLLNAINVFDVDHIMFTPRRSVVNKLARKSLPMIGDACWHCHAGVGSFPLQVAVKYNIGLLIYGESVSENDGRATYEAPIPFDREYITRISARFYAEEMVDDEINLFDVNPYILSTIEEIEKKSIKSIHLGDFIFWDDERQMEFVRDNFGWREDNVEGTYKRYKSVECIMAGIHDYTKFIKRGFGRGSDHASQDVKAGLLTREEGFELAKKYDAERPGALDYYLRITGYSENEFQEILKEKREGKAKDLP